jgi:hypothetical protein
MSGHVFHPGHAELHGITVVLETSGSLTYVGRYDKEDDGAVHMHDVGVHDAAAAGGAKAPDSAYEPTTSIWLSPPTKFLRLRDLRS